MRVMVQCSLVALFQIWSERLSSFLSTCRLSTEVQRELLIRTVAPRRLFARTYAEHLVTGALFSPVLFF